MSYAVPVNRRLSDAAIAGLVLLGTFLAVVRGARLVDYSALDLVVPIAFPALVATFVYLRFEPDVSLWVPVALFAWGCVAGFVAMFVGFFAVVDNPGAGPGTVTTASLVLDAVGRFVAGTVGLSVVYGIAGYADRLVVVLLAPVVQFLALVPLALVR